MKPEGDGQEHIKSYGWEDQASNYAEGICLLACLFHMKQIPVAGKAKYTVMRLKKTYKYQQ